MLYSKNLRAIGQSLETLRVEEFDLEKDGDAYVVRSRSLTPTSQWILRNTLIEGVWDSAAEEKSTRSTGGNGWLRYDPLDISRLDVQGRKRRKSQAFAEMRGANKLSQLLRTLGEHLDRTEATVFNISWGSDAVSVDYATSDGNRERRSFSIEKLQQLSLHSRFGRLSRRG
jgi:hypothetical protein